MWSCNYNTELPAKHSVSDVQIKAVAECSIQHNGRPVFYTDGSVQSRKAGAGVIHEGKATALRLNDCATILQSELAAINAALKQVNDKGMPSALIVTDPRSALAAIDTVDASDNKSLIRSIQYTASQFNNTPELLWVPAHVGIEGNEQVDKAAKSVLFRATTDFHIHSSKKQLHNHIKKTATDIHDAIIHHELCKSVALNQKLQMSKSEKRQLWKMPRLIHKDIFKLRTYVKTYKQITEGHDTCHYCDYTFDVYTDHYLIECPANRIYRSKLITGNVHHMTSTKTEVTAILQDQARHGHKTLAQLITKYPLTQ